MLVALCAADYHIQYASLPSTAVCLEGESEAGAALTKGGDEVGRVGGLGLDIIPQPVGVVAGVFLAAGHGTGLTLGQDVIRQLHAGITWINTWGESPAEMPVGGWKMSGIGLENGEEGIRAYMRTKSTLVQLGKGAAAGLFAKL
ncbi:hypothetical protein NLG97_g5536 [Lecanicillium saksenae]|uniref:Uncharacterized protein n=1 Tax=Lecanicillium saksenae TaxID=468837 RepID=A0ACC1QUQ4_9HYPO|nr:hypothetical protein NLG97_g5536 [Lecanicillium saksenae]